MEEDSISDILGDFASKVNAVEHQAECLDQDPPFQKLPGETSISRYVWPEGFALLTDYRFFFIQHDAPSVHLDVPLGCIEAVEIRETNQLFLTCKDGQCHRCNFDNPMSCADMLKFINTAMTSQLFAFKFFTACQENPEAHHDFLSHLAPVTQGWSIEEEFDRLKFNKSVWEISKCNENYKLCQTYPEQLIMPKHLIVPKASDEAENILEKVATFRHFQRIPTVVWRHPGNGVVIARCSQPAVSLFWTRNNQDEALVQAILEACACDSGPDVGISPLPSPTHEDLPNGNLNQEEDCVDSAPLFKFPKPKLLIIDARAYSVACVNRVRGGGCEYEEYYTNCEIRFMNLPNIHNVRRSFQSFRTACATSFDQTRWFSVLEATNWLHYISALLKTALAVVEAVEDNRRPVLVHCSDGWDRTPQIVSLAELCLDPFYRTMAGFQTLVEREWVGFGHKFADRCGHSNFASQDINERCPVFLQFLNCVYQLLRQFPCSFEFNSRYLEDLAHHTYSGLYGNFLCNSGQDRHNMAENKTFSVWSCLNSAPPTLYRNYLYYEKHEVLRPSSQLVDLFLWNEFYLPPPPPPTKTDHATGNISLGVRPLDTQALGQALSRHSSTISLAGGTADGTLAIGDCNVVVHEDTGLQRTVSTCTLGLKSEQSCQPLTLTLSPRHSRTPSSGFPATPSDEPPPQSNTRPLSPPWHALNHVATTPDKIQDRLHQIFSDFENERANLHKEISSSKQYCPCREKNLSSPYPSEAYPNEEEFEVLSLEDCCSPHQCRKCGLSFAPPSIPSTRCKQQSQSGPKQHVSKPPVVSTGST